MRSGQGRTPPWEKWTVPLQGAAAGRLVCVYRATVRGRLPIAESLLRSADIPFVVLGGHIQQLAGVDGYGFAEVHVAATDAADTRGLLADLDRHG